MRIFLRASLVKQDLKCLKRDKSQLGNPSVGKSVSWEIRQLGNISGGKAVRCDIPYIIYGITCTSPQKGSLGIDFETKF